MQVFSGELQIFTRCNRGPWLLFPPGESRIKAYRSVRGLPEIAVRLFIDILVKFANTDSGANPINNLLMRRAGLSNRNMWPTFEALTVLYLQLFQCPTIEWPGLAAVGQVSFTFTSQYILKLFPKTKLQCCSVAVHCNALCPLSHNHSPCLKAGMIPSASKQPRHENHPIQSRQVAGPAFLL